MADVVRAFEQAGCREVTSYGHAGNLLWSQDSRGVPVDDIRARLAALVGGAAEMAVRTERQLRAVVTAAPFGPLGDDRRLKLYVVFLARPAKQLPPLPLVDARECLELVAVRGRDAYVVSRRKPNGMFGFPNAFVEAALGVPATSRNWSTVTRVVALLRTV
jgi:uncharacterized protein (DUF1697 family)